ncbi:MAG: hypothetical protein VYB54_03120 [Pseudomonadota bacterium]|nr:hypothetical protein [Pseudomonadota bacterium]
MTALPAAALVAVALAACTPTQPVEITQHRQFQSPYPPGTTVVIEPPAGDGAVSLAEASYRDALAARLAQAGYTVTGDRSAARLVATLEASVGAAETGVHENRVPEYANIRRRVRLNDGSTQIVNDSFLIGYRTERFTYNIWPARVQLFLADNERGGERVFEGDVRTRGSCDRMEALIRPMLEAMFAKSPGPDGKVIRDSVEVPDC